MLTLELLGPENTNALLLEIIQTILMTSCWLSGKRSLPFGLLMFFCFFLFFFEDPVYCDDFICVSICLKIKP